MGVRRRLDRLERDLGGPCPECGGPWKPGDPIEYVVVWDAIGVPEPLPPCSKCGREREIVIVWPVTEPLLAEPSSTTGGERQSKN